MDHDTVVFVLLVLNVLLAGVNIALAIPRTRVAQRKLDAWEYRPRTKEDTDWDGEL